MPDPREHSRLQRSITGAVAATTALAVGQFISSLDPNGPTLIDAVGAAFIDGFAAALKDIAVAIFGVHDKTALVIGVWVVAIGLSVLGQRAGRRTAAGIWAAAAVIGFAAHTSRPGASALIGAVSVIGALGSGLAIVLTLDHRRPPLVPPTPASGGGDRRQFLALVGGAIAGSVTLVALGRVLHERTPTVARVLRLPEPTRAVTPPADTGITATGLSPYITPIDDFYRIDTALRVPRVDPTSWSLTIDGMVNTPLTIDYDALLAEAADSVPVTIACVSNQIGGDLIGTAIWQGVPLERLIERASPHAAATQMVGHSIDGFTAGMPTAVALDGRTALVAYAMNGEPLPERHGFPARLIVAGLYGYVSATKWLTRIELTTMDGFDGYWIPRGWAKQAPVKIASRIDVPARGTISPGQTAVAGVAWAPSTGIAAVEVSIDGGPWRTATLGRVASDDTWVQWLYPWDATVGEHTITVRAIDRHGIVQTDAVTAVAPDGATGHHRRRVTVR